MAKKETTIYEIGYNLIPTASSEEVAKEVGAMKEKITSLGGELISDEYPNQIKLSYEMIKEIDNKNVKFNSAFFGWIKFEMDSEKVNEIDKMAKLSDNMLRYIIIKTVRENTLHTPKFTKPGRKTSSDDSVEVSKPEVSSEAEPMNVKEVDKKIDELLEEETDL